MTNPKSSRSRIATDESASAIPILPNPFLRARNLCPPPPKPSPPNSSPAHRSQSSPTTHDQWIDSGRKAEYLAAPMRARMQAS